MVKKVLPLAVATAGIALVVGGIAFATELPPLGGAEQAATTSTQTDAVIPLEGNSGQGAARCSDATGHALEVLQARQAAGEEVGDSIAAVQACGTGADGSESSSEAGPPEWVPGPPPWAGAEDGNGVSEGANTAGPPEWVPGPPPCAGAEDGNGGPDQAATTSTQSDLVAPLNGNSGQGSAHCADATAHALEVLLARQAAGGEVGNSITAIQACGTGAGGASEGANKGGPPDWVPGPPPWADGQSPE